MNPEYLDALVRFNGLLRGPLGDGAAKRAVGQKLPWYIETPKSHLESLERHWDAYQAGERRDPDSGCHPLQHRAVRGLMVAAHETGNVPRDGVLLAPPSLSLP